MTNSIFGINSYIELDIDEYLPKEPGKDPLDVIIDASKAGLFSQFFTRDGHLWARIAGEFDNVMDFQSTLK